LFSNTTCNDTASATTEELFSTDGVPVYDEDGAGKKATRKRNNACTKTAGKIAAMRAAGSIPFLSQKTNFVLVIPFGLLSSKREGQKPAEATQGLY